MLSCRLAYSAPQQPGLAQQTWVSGDTWRVPSFSHKWEPSGVTLASSTTVSTSRSEFESWVCSCLAAESWARSEPAVPHFVICDVGEGCADS